jgi:hypothetical protein
MKKIFTLLFAALALSANLWAANIGAWTSSQCNVTLSDNGVLTISKISSQGLMDSYTATKESEWYPFREQITSAVIEDGVSQIGARVFLNCSNMTSVTIANTVVSIGNHAFDGCSSLTTLTIPESVNIIGTAAFKGCESLQSISCKIITPVELDGDAFKNVSRSIPLYVPWQSVDEYNAAAIWQDFNVLPDPTQCPAWGNCGLQGDNVTWYLDCDGRLIVSGTGAMENYTKDNHLAPWSVRANTVKTIIIGEGVTTIGDYAFKDCISATSLTIANSVVSIGRNAFAQCRNLTEVTIPGAVTNIGQYAFSGCYRITTLSILSSKINSLPIAAFGSCNGLESILCAATIPPTCHAETFKDIDITEINQIKLYVPGNSKSLYQNAPIWQDFDVQASAKKRILFVDEEGNELKVASVDEGVEPNADELTPTKADDEDYTYEFDGWLPTIQPATQDYVYVTHFVRTPKKFFNVGIGGANCALNVTNKVPEGTYLEVTVAPEDCYQFTQWSDGDNNNPRIIQVTENTNISADCTKIIYTIEGQAQGSGAVTIAPKQ